MTTGSALAPTDHRHLYLATFYGPTRRRYYVMRPNSDRPDDCLGWYYRKDDEPFLRFRSYPTTKGA